MKILVVDDEAPIRESIVRLLTQMGMTDIREARDGIEALEEMGRSRPELVIADIRMPGMDGLKLLAAARESKLDAMFIFVSGYDLFEYAQKAVRLGAIGYLLKPIKDNELKDLLDQALERITYDRQQRDALSRMQSAMNQGIHLMRKRFVSELAKDNVLSERYIEEKCRELNVHVPERLLTVLYLSIDDYRTKSDDLSAREKDLRKFSLENISMEVCAAHGLTPYSFDLEDGLGLLLNFADSHVVAGTDGMDAMCAEINRNISRFTKMTVTVGIGSRVVSLDAVKQSFTAAEQAVMQRMVKGGNRVIRLDEAANEPVAVPSSLTVKKEQELIRYFEQRDEAAALRFVEELFSPYRKAAVFDAGPLMKLNFQLVMLMFKSLNHLNINPEETLGDEFHLYSQVNRFAEIDAVVDWFAVKLGVCFALVRSKQENSHSVLIEKAKTYIKLNFNKEITLEGLAEHVHLSPPYFSKLFKEEVGENFSAYLLDYRMNAARELLKEGTYKAHQVAEMVGFHNEKYFFKVFKREIGVTPSEYKKL